LQIAKSRCNWSPTKQISRLSDEQTSFTDRILPLAKSYQHDNDVS
jgi:hypothetical protein